jgi:hypothetical protein
MIKLSVVNMISAKGNPVPNQFIIHADDGCYFQSYQSIIAHKAHDGTVTLGADWDYSRTTGKYRNDFLNEGVVDTRRKLEQGIYKFDKEL